MKTGQDGYCQETDLRDSFLRKYPFMLVVHRNQTSSGTKQFAPVQQVQVMKRALKMSPKLNDHATDDDQSQA